MHPEAGRFDFTHGDEDEIDYEEAQRKLDYEYDHADDYKHEDEFK